MTPDELHELELTREEAITERTIGARWYDEDYQIGRMERRYENSLLGDGV
jgi:hypothetical protein